MALSLGVTACDPIEDTDDQSKFDNAGEAISSADLTKALSVTQLPNVEGQDAGDQYVIVKNSRPDIGGVWIFKKGDVTTTYGTDADTIVLGSNGTYEVTYRGISNNKIVTSDPIEIVVTNVFDIFDQYLTGAKSKSDINATKKWKMRRVVDGSTVAYCHNGAHGAWKYTSAGYTPEKVNGVAWWGTIGDSQIGDYTKRYMIFSYKGNAMASYRPDGSVASTGNFSYNHDAVETGVLGEFLPSYAPLGGAAFDECAIFKKQPVYYLLTLNDKYMTLYHPAKIGGEDWSDCGWYVFYEAVDE